MDAAAAASSDAAAIAQAAKRGFVGTFFMGIVYGLQPDSLFVILPALTLPSRAAAAAYITAFVAGTVLAMGSYTGIIGTRRLWMCGVWVLERVPGADSGLPSLSRGGLVLSEMLGTETSCPAPAHRSVPPTRRRRRVQFAVAEHSQLQPPSLLDRVHRRSRRRGVRPGASPRSCAAFLMHAACVMPPRLIPLPPNPRSVCEHRVQQAGMPHVCWPHRGTHAAFHNATKRMLEPPPSHRGQGATG